METNEAGRRLFAASAGAFAPVVFCLVGIALAIIVFSSAGVFAWHSAPISQEQPGGEAVFIGVDEIRPGDTGIAKTVFSGTAVEEFGVEVLGVLSQGGASHPYIIVRVYGDAIERAGGIADGMSGSPVYLRGRLAGAISHVYQATDRRVGLVTPIEPMLKLLSLATGCKHEAPEGTLPVRSPLLVSGMSGRSLEMVSSALTVQRSVVVAPSADGRSYAQTGPVVPGSAISVQLVDGDISISSIGTVTYVDSDAFVAFGHHFEAAGTVDYIASAAEVVLIAKSDDGPFKIAAPLGPVGRVTQDRFVGLAGMLGTEAATVDVTVGVRDTETGEERTYEFTVIQDERFVYSLIVAGVLEALDSTLGRIGQGTSTVSMSIRLSNGATVTRSNTYSDRFDIAMWSLNEIGEAVGLIAFSEDTAAGLASVSICAGISPEIRTARIESVTTEEDTVEPGDILSVQIVLRPYRSEAVVREVEIAVPADTGPGCAHLSVRGGSEVLGAYGGVPVSEHQAGDTEPEPYPFERGSDPDLYSRLEEFAARPKGTDLILELYLPGPPDTRNGAEDQPDREPAYRPEPPAVPTEFGDEAPREDDEGDRPAFPAARTPYAADEIDGPVRVVVPLDWVVHGYGEAGIEIVVPEESGPAVQSGPKALTEPLD